MVNKVKGNLIKNGIDVYFKIILGSHLVTTKTIESADRDFVMEEKHSFYAEPK